MPRPEGGKSTLFRAALVASLLVSSGLLLAAAVWAAEPPGLKGLMPRETLIGVALNQRQGDGRDSLATSIVTRNFNSVTPENILKWEKVHPEPGRYDFAPVDRFLAFAEKRGMTVIGHCLVWHSQTPAWVFEGKDGAPLDRETALSRMGEHIRAVVGRYKGRIKGWDVVNEAIEDDAEGSLRKSRWREAIGDDYVAKAFEYAHQADPQAELYYNDFNLAKGPKRAAALRLLKQLRAWGVRVDGVGEQGHWLIDWPSPADIEATVTDIASAGFRVLITELDVDVLPRDPGMFGADLEKRARYKAETNLYPDGLPKAKQDELARRYADIFAVFAKHRDKVSRVTLWGVTDAQTWLHDFPVPGRVNHPLLFDRKGQPKPAFDAVVEVLKKAGAQ